MWRLAKPPLTPALCPCGEREPGPCAWRSVLVHLAGFVPRGGDQGKIREMLGEIDALARRRRQADQFVSQRAHLGQPLRGRGRRGIRPGPGRAQPIRAGASRASGAQHEAGAAPRVPAPSAMPLSARLPHPLHAPPPVHAVRWRNRAMRAPLAMERLGERRPRGLTRIKPPARGTPAGQAEACNAALVALGTHGRRGAGSTTRPHGLTWRKRSAQRCARCRRSGYICLRTGRGIRAAATTRAAPRVPMHGETKSC